MELEIQVVEARNLASINILGKPNPMCALVMGNHTFSTKGNSNARAPTWHETFTIPITDANTEILQLVIKDPNYVKNGSVICNCELPISTLCHGQTKDTWIPLQTGTKKAGELHILATLRQQQPNLQQNEATPAIQPNTQQSTKKSFEFNIRVKAGKDLHDTQLIGKQDPFCKVTIGDKTFQTRVHDNGGRNPKWDEAFVFRLTDPHLDQLTIHIEDSNTVSNSSIGTCQLPVSIWSGGRSVEQWYPVNHGGKQRGEILLAVQLVEVLKVMAKNVDGSPRGCFDKLHRGCVDKNLRTAQRCGIDMDVLFERADKDKDGMLSGAEFLGALESFECFTASEKEQIRQSLTKRDKSISLGDLRGLYESAIESEWKNIFHHPVDGIPKAKAQVIAKVENSTKPSVIKTSQKTKTTKVPATTAPKDVVCMMTEEQLDRLIDAIPQFKGPSKSNKAEVVKATQAEPRKPVALYKPSKV
ncbi:hypothetical protein DYB25_000419 [Aphanomyces astaci]|uniref:Uncharacterized protein n=1 Tax=Aphanomyces astaci TaxID=112090 RepID=A0A397ANV2_APHAT|nr:hypothetical protein DYB25_000419 [Aphanomyces astaci]